VSAWYEIAVRASTMYQMTIIIPGLADQVEIFGSAPEAWEWMRNEYLDDWDLVLGTPLSTDYSATYPLLSAHDPHTSGSYTVADRSYAIELTTLRRPQHARAHHNQVHQSRLVEDVEHLLKSTRPDAIAKRLGYADPENLRVALNRLGRRDLGTQFTRTSWDPMVEENRNHKETPHTAVREK
jgi:hypothetical protein